MARVWAISVVVILIIGGALLAYVTTENAGAIESTTAPVFVYGLSYGLLGTAVVAGFFGALFSYLFTTSDKRAEKRTKSLDEHTENLLEVFHQAVEIPLIVAYDGTPPPFRTSTPLVWANTMSLRNEALEHLREGAYQNARKDLILAERNALLKWKQIDKLLGDLTVAIDQTIPGPSWNVAVH